LRGYAVEQLVQGQNACFWTSSVLRQTIERLYADHHRGGEKRNDDGRESVCERQKVGPPSTKFEPTP
jgi:hypothetical protein